MAQPAVSSPMQSSRGVGESVGRYSARCQRFWASLAADGVVTETLQPPPTSSQPSAVPQSTINHTVWSVRSGQTEPDRVRLGQTGFRLGSDWPDSLVQTPASGTLSCREGQPVVEAPTVPANSEGAGMSAASAGD